MEPRVSVVGAGIGGLAAAVRLAAGGARVSVLERSPALGGKAVTALVGGRGVAAGPTVLTLRPFFEELFALAGTSLDAEVGLRPLTTLARHAFPDGTVFDLHADAAASRDAVGRAFGAGAARELEAFYGDAKRIYDVVYEPFMRSAAPSTLDLMRRVGSLGLGALTRIDAFRSMAKALAARFTEPRLRHVFARYATYCGASPFEAPATFNVVAYVEALGVYRVDGGVAALVAALRRVAERLGVSFHTGVDVEGLVVEGGRVRGTRSAIGHSLADAVVWNGDVAALAAVTGQRAGRPMARADRSLSALTWRAVGHAAGFPLAHHTVAFAADYDREFTDLFHDERAPTTPTVYVCAEDRDGDEAPRGTDAGEERFLVIVNAPATGDDASRWTSEEISRCERAMEQTLRGAGITLHSRERSLETPVDFARRFPATGGAIYGARPKGAFSPLSRPGSRTKLAGLYVAGGSVHPGPGVPMALMSGRLAAEALLSDLRSTRPSRLSVTSGTTSTA